MLYSLIDLVIFPKARKSAPGTLCMKHTRYVTKNGQFQLPTPHYESTKMKVEDKDASRCLSRSYFSELRKKAKDNGAERYSLMLRLIIGRNTTTESYKSLDYDKVLVSRRRQKKVSMMKSLPIMPINNTQMSGQLYKYTSNKREPVWEIQFSDIHIRISVLLIMKSEDKQRIIIGKFAQIYRTY